MKIGFTTNLPARFKQLQTMSPSILYLLKCIESDYQYEKSLHHKFKQYREHGEFYTLSPELLNFIEELEWCDKFKNKQDT